MTWLGEQPDTFFIGQSVGNEGTAMFNSLKGVPIEKRLELPVIEETQMGMSTGMALNGTVPISLYPRWDFLILASNQLVNHLNRLKKYSADEYAPKVIIRVGIGSVKPLHPHFQHMNDYTDAFKLMLDNIEVIKLEEAAGVMPAYQRAYQRDDGKSTLLVEHMDYYNEK